MDPGLNVVITLIKTSNFTVSKGVLFRNEQKELMKNSTIVLLAFLRKP